MYKCIFPHFRHWLEMSGRLDDPAATIYLKGGWAGPRAGLEDMASKNS
jgi:hypothetical protein